MPYYLIQASYTAAATAAMVKNPQDRAMAVAPIIEKAGGKLHGLWLAFGEFDIVAVAEVPDNTAAAALAMAIGSSGALSAYRTTPMMTPAESVAAMKKAGTVSYQPPK